MLFPLQEEPEPPRRSSLPRKPSPVDGKRGTSLDTIGKRQTRAACPKQNWVCIYVCIHIYIYIHIIYVCRYTHSVFIDRYMYVYVYMEMHI